jgi:hypothetical protein
MLDGPAGTLRTDVASHRSQRRWWLIGLVVVVVIATVAAGLFIVGGRKQEAQPQASLPGLPEQMLLSSPMKRPPLPGWKINSTQLGLPPGAVVKPLRNVGDRGYFLGITGNGWWLVGIDVATGRRLFAPVPLGTAENALGIDCFANGPTDVLCIRDERDPNQQARTWIVDTQTGNSIFDAVTDLRMRPAENHPHLIQVGNYVVAEVARSGVHGVGRQAELTWFVPGDGVLKQTEAWSRDVAPQMLAVQGGAGWGDVVFSVSDGKLVKPSLPASQQLGRAIVYPNGFGYEYTGPDKSDRVSFFDNSGRVLSRPELNGTLLTGSLDVPMIETESKDVVMALDGRNLLEVPKSELTPYVRRIGTKLFIATDERQNRWQQYDLRTGSSDKTCELDLGFGYIGSDGVVAIIADGSSADAIDLTTCAPLWALPHETRETAIEVWKVNTTLIQRTNDELFSLVAPN